MKMPKNIDVLFVAGFGRQEGAVRASSEPPKRYRVVHPANGTTCGSQSSEPYDFLVRPRIGKTSTADGTDDRSPKCLPFSCFFIFWADDATRRCALRTSATKTTNSDCCSVHGRLPACSK
jgi:hypothetical protein